MKLKKTILKYITACLLSLILFVGVFHPLKSRADVGLINMANGTQVAVGDSGGLMGILADTAKTVGLWAEDWAKDLAAWVRDNGAALAYRKALDYFLQQLAHDTAVYLATGDKGQSPMFYTESWGDYLTNVADNAVGTFLEELGESGTTKFNLCDPGIDITMKIGYGMMQSKDPDEPDCTFTEMKDNWESELRNPDFLNRFGNMFEPQSNNFGITLFNPFI